MVQTCCVYGCKSNYDKVKANYVSVFKFPDNIDRKNEWIRKIPNKNLKITKQSKVCIKHFDEKDIIRSDVFPCANGDPDIIVSIIFNTLLTVL